MDGDAPTLALLARLAKSPDIRDRAFAAGVLSLRRHAEDPEQVAALYQHIREAAQRHHAGLRARISDGTLDAHAFVAELRQASLEVRDHLVEEVLGIAYPPLEASALPREVIPYCPSGLAEILFMLDNADLRPGATFVDLGSGLGKVVLLVALLTGASAYGVEIDPCLVSHARAAARSLQLDNAHFLEGDIRDVPLPSADVYYMYIPLIQSTAVVARLTAVAAERRILLFSQALDLTYLPWLRPGNAACYWLEMYRGPDRLARRPARRSKMTDCEQRIHDTRTAVLLANDGVVTRRMTELEREWLTLSRADPETGTMEP